MPRWPSRKETISGRRIVDREVVAGPPIAPIYRLTDRGRSLEPALPGLARWADANLEPSD